MTTDDHARSSVQRACSPSHSRESDDAPDRERSGGLERAESVVHYIRFDRKKTHCGKRPEYWRDTSNAEQVTCLQCLKKSIQ